MAEAGAGVMAEAGVTVAVAVLGVVRLVQKVADMMRGVRVQDKSALIVPNERVLVIRRGFCNRGSGRIDPACKPCRISVK